MIKRFFKILSGKPKSGDVIESIRPTIVIPIWMLSIFLLHLSVRYSNVFLGYFALLFSWQIGWGMSIERFNNIERRK